MNLKNINRVLKIASITKTFLYIYPRAEYPSGQASLEQIVRDQLLKGFSCSHEYRGNKRFTWPEPYLFSTSPAILQDSFRTRWIALQLGVGFAVHTHQTGWIARADNRCCPANRKRIFYLASPTLDPTSCFTFSP